MWQRTIDCLGLAVSVASPLPDLEPPLTSVLRSYADTPRPADLAYRLERREHPCLVRDGIVVNTQQITGDLVPAFELDLYTRVIGAAPGLLLHASAVVGASGAAMVFTGRSGAGKSTLVRALLARGFRYLSEECVALEAGQRCRGLARALHIDDATLPVPDGYVCDDYVLSGHPTRGLRLFHPPERMIWRGEARTAAVVAIDHAPDANAELERLTGGPALATLWPTVFRPDPDALDLARAALEGVPAFRLHTARPEQALEHVLALAVELGVHPG